MLHRLPDDLPDEATTEREYVSRAGLKSALTVPVAVAGRRVCALSISSFRRHRAWTPPIVDGLRFTAEILGAALNRRRQDHALHRSQDEIARLNRQLESENVYLREQIRDLHGFDEITGDSPALRDALIQVQEVAATDSTVLLLGETGTGKELFARAVHDRSPRRHAPLVRVNCAALPATLIESELFGHERGAYTGAVTSRQGRFELADRGTIFLDEIGDLPVEVQVKLLRVLQDGEFERLGSSHTRKVDVRVVAATHRDLEASVREGRFRPDLYYRLSVFPIRLPPLRERREDIPRLVWFFIHHQKRGLHRQVKKVPAAVMTALQTYDWPGNVRELQNVIERAMIRSTADTLVLDEGLGVKTSRIEVGDDDTLESVERRHIEETLRKCGWRINGAGNAADQLGLHPNTLRFRLRKLGITRPARARQPRER
jgi:transcriptional regulator with GAF, ATPase, and Fis domain